LGKGSKTLTRHTLRGSTKDMAKFFPRFVFLVTPHHELQIKSLKQLPSPIIIHGRLTNPDGAGVVNVSFFVNLRDIRTLIDMVCCRKHLGSLKNHLDNVLITMHLGCNMGIFVEDKDVHGYIISDRKADVNGNFRKTLLEGIQANPR
jgi:hypothetical protein